MGYRRESGHPPHERTTTNLRVTDQAGVLPIQIPPHDVPQTGRAWHRSAPRTPPWRPYTLTQWVETLPLFSSTRG